MTILDDLSSAEMATPQQRTVLCKRAHDEIVRLRDGMDAIRQYGSDTLLGPSKRADDTRGWQRDGVLEMTNRAVRVLNGDPWLSEENCEPTE